MTSTMEQLKSTQMEKATEIERAISNIKKAPIDRRTLDFYRKKSEELTSLWEAFQKAENVIRNDPAIPENDPYLLQDLYKSVGALYSTTMDEMEACIKALTTSNYKPIPEHRQSKPQDSQAAATEYRQGLIRRVLARMTALNRFLDGLSAVVEGQPHQFYNVKVDTINRLWNQIQTLLDEVWQHCEDPFSAGLNQKEYDALEDLVQQYLISLSVMVDKSTSASHSGRLADSDLPFRKSLPLPKVTIPQFNGDCLKWHQFYELFSEMVDKQPLPDVQKMWYLKTNVSGEAGNLISHLTLSEENYTTAWTLLQDRYNNKRVIVATLVEKILNQPTGTSSTAAIKGLHDTTRECLLALNNLKIDTSSWDAILLQLLIKKVDRNLHIRFVQSLSKPKEVPKIEELLSFLEIQFQSMESVGCKTANQQNTSRAVSSVASSDGNNYCRLCSNNKHPIYHCSRFLKMAEGERLKWVQQQKLCFNCFKGDHSAKVCTAGSCKKCNHKHNTLLHLNNKQKSIKQSPLPQQPGTQSTILPSSSTNQTASSSTVAAAQPSIAPSSSQRYGRQGSVLLATARIKITANNGRSGEFRAILDSGSQINIVTERLVKRLSIEARKTSLSIEGIGGKSKTTNQRVNVRFQSTTSSFSSRLEAFVLPSIVPAQPSNTFDISTWPIPGNILLADPYFNSTSTVDVLLGAEFYFDLMLSGKIRLTNELPILRNTKLGWIASGRIEEGFSDPPVCAIYGEDELATSELIQQFWKVDDFHSDTKLTLAEQKCETHFLQHTTRNEKGRFVVRLPFADDQNSLGESRSIAHSRFLALERRLERNPHLQQQYIDFMTEYEALGHMTRIDTGNIQGAHFFIPHHCVLRPDSSTTKLRVVFDASAKTTSGCSLNDILCTGPTVQGDLFGMLLRFRLPKFVLTTDIEKMYRQILVDKEDRKFQLIFWRNKPSEMINVYMLNTVTYGTTSAPYMATKCLQQLADINKNRYPLGAQMLQQDFYVDDGMSGSDSLATAIEMQKQLTKLLQEAGFKPRKWCANHTQLLQGIPPEDREVNLDFENTSTKVLGLTWIPKTDQFCLKADVTDCATITKRSVTSDVARIFDPLGIAGPVVSAAKIFIQKLWQMQISWDDPLPTVMSQEWSSFRNKLTQLNNTRLSRHVFDSQRVAHVQLHVFVDASEKAYGAALYLRSKLEDGRLIVRLLCAKSRVAPLKELTLPRLELCAAALGAELTARVKKELRFENTPTFYWSDSEIVLYWIHSTSSALRTFVANKVIKIQTLTASNQWRHVRTKDNPADFISRGLSPDRLATCNLWFYGPTFLHGKEIVWPKPFTKEAQTPTNLEFKQKIAVTTVASSGNMLDIIYRINHQNSFRRLQRITAYVNRFVESLKDSSRRPKCLTLTPQELDDALSLIVRTMQEAEFETEISQLTKYGAIDKSSSLSSLTPFIDIKGVLRIGGRLENSDLSFNAKHPIILPYNDPITKLILNMIHNDNHHCGPQLLLATSRQKFWIIKGKSMARNIVQNCVRCTRARPKLFQQIMGNLPSSRVTPARPFIKTGVDYCGPFWVHYKLRGKRPHKVYIAVFCCFVTKAVHLEVVTDLTTEAFIGALKRFLARRGRCQTIYSDNATNFIGAKNQLEELNQAIFATKSQDVITTACVNEGIEFKFIPPRAPHFGGLWEAAVKSAKHLLLRTVSNASLTHEELETVVIEIEAILNSRPLTPISTNINDLGALTPGHFLIGEPLTAQVDARASQPTTSLSTRWKLVSQLKHEFWRRWSTEYLTQLQERKKWKSTSSNIKVGQLVIIKEDNTPVMKWPLGRIIELYPGNDGVIRVVGVKTASGVMKRPIHRLAPLLNDESDVNQTIIHSEDIATETSSQPTPVIDNSSEPSPAKRRKSAFNIAIMSALIVLLLLPACLGQSIKIQRFNSDPGIYFEGIGTTRLITAEWKIVTYYELGPFWAELDAFSTQLQTLQHLCEFSSKRTMCDTIVTNFNQIQLQLLEDKTRIFVRRIKRGALNVVGNFARTLFGVLDSDYAEEMSQTINNIRLDQGHMLKLLRNQTSVIDSTINIIKQDELANQDRIHEMQKNMLTLSNDIGKEDQELRTTQSLGFLSSQLTLTSIRLQQIEANILDVLTDAHHGRISPLLLAPHQLQQELHTIRAHLPPSRTLPIEEENLIEAYKLMNAKGTVTENKVIFEIRLPLVDQQHFDLFKLIPVPSSKNGYLFAVSPDTSFLAVNAHRDEYIPISTDDIKNCFHSKTDEFICQNRQARFGKDSQSYSCEFHLFTNKSSTDCKLIRVNDDTVWIKLSKTNHWIFVITNGTEISSVCGNEISQLTLKGTGILQINPDCILKDNTVTIQGHYDNSTLLYTSYARLKPLEALSTSREVSKIFVNHNTIQESHVHQLKDLQKQLKSADLENISAVMKSTSQHHHAVSYAALLLGIVLTISYIISLRCKSRTNQMYITQDALPQPNPLPTPRHHLDPIQAVAVSTN